jgi:hypothetical protein
MPIIITIIVVVVNSVTPETEGSSPYLQQPVVSESLVNNSQQIKFFTGGGGLAPLNP